MNNFERMKSLDDKYEMTDLIMYVLSTRYSAIIKGGGELDGLPVLSWLQEEYNKEE